MSGEFCPQAWRRQLDGSVTFPISCPRSCAQSALGIIMPVRCMKFIHQPASSERLGDYLKEQLTKSWTHFRAAVAFVKRSGTRHLSSELCAFARTGHVEIVAGIDHRGTSSEGLRDLLAAVSPSGRVIVFHNVLPFTFHPKIYLFKSSTTADAVVGSGNLTEGGLFTNYEASFRVSLDLSDPKQAAILLSIEQALNAWADPSTGTALFLDDQLLTKLTAEGLTPSEDFLSDSGGNRELVGEHTSSVALDSPFAARHVPKAPPFQTPSHEPGLSGREVTVPPTSLTPARVNELGVGGFVMTLQRTDVGVGQTTSGTSRRSPEIFIPLAARNACPAFWNWPTGFVEDPGKHGKLDRQDVRMLLNGTIVSVNMMTWPPKRDFRLRSEALRSAGKIGDIIRMEKVDSVDGYEYTVEVIPKDTSRYFEYLRRCNQAVRNSKRKYGYY